MRVFTCVGTLEAMMTCIYDAWEWALSHGHDQMRLQIEPVRQYTLFDTYVHVEADEEKAKSVIRSICTKISVGAYVSVYYATLYEQDVLDEIYRFLRYGFRHGSSVMYQLAEPVVMRMMQIQRAVGNETHLLREFTRFDCISDAVYVSHLEPKSDVIYLVARHFADRVPSEAWMIIDDGRKTAAVHAPDEEIMLRELTDDEFDRLRYTEQGDDYQILWKTFFDRIAIQQRINRECQRNHFPQWMRKHATEFREEYREA